MPKSKLLLHYQKYYDAQVIHLDNGLIICRKDDESIRSYFEVEKFEKYFKLLFKRFELSKCDMTFNVRDLCKIANVSSFKLKKLKKGISKISTDNYIGIYPIRQN